MSVARRFFLYALVVAFSSAAGEILAEGGGFYAGATVSVERLDVSYDKRLSPPTPPLHDANSADETGYGFGVLAGYRMPLHPNGAYLGAELDLSGYDRAARGNLRGVHLTPGTAGAPTSNGDSWPERWRFEKEHGYGMTLQLGTSLAGGDANLYALAGFRRVEVQFDTAFSGCEVAVEPTCTPATPGLYSHYTETQERTMTAWVWGAGLEKRIGEATALRGEIRYTEYENDRRVEEYPGPSPSDPLLIPRDLDGDEVSVTLGLIRYF